MLEVTEIRRKIKQVITNVANIPPEDVGDSASFRNELGLDSLSLLEIGVDVDFEFKLQLPDERFKELDSVEEMVDLVVRELSQREGGPAVAQA